MIALLLALQAAAAQAAAPPAPTTGSAAPATAAPHIMAIDPAEAVDLFKTLCVAHPDDEVAFAEAVTAAPVSFAAITRRDARPGQSWRADRAWVSYGPDQDGGTRCTLLGRVKGSVDQLSFAARVATALALKPGRTRTGAGQAVTDWTMRGPDGRALAVSAATRAAAGGGTDIRLSTTLAR